MTLTTAMQAVALTAETMARCSQRRWWQRNVTPFEFVPVAREIVAALISAGHIDRASLTDEI